MRIVGGWRRGGGRGGRMSFEWGEGDLVLWSVLGGRCGEEG